MKIMNKNVQTTTAILRFVLSFIIILCTLIWFGSLFFVNIPVQNVRIVDIASGIILGQGWVTIVKWWFPSDINSERKTELLAKAEPVKEGDQ
jgi:hypothetical protein